MSVVRLGPVGAAVLYIPETAGELLPALDLTVAALLNAETTPPTPGGG